MEVINYVCTFVAASVFVVIFSNLTCTLTIEIGLKEHA